MTENTRGIVEAYEQWLRSWTSSKATIQARTVIAEGRLREWGGPGGITADRIEQWLSGFDGWTRATYYQHVKSLCTWLHLSGRLETNPITDLHAPIQPKSLPRPLSRAQVELALSAAQGDVGTWLRLSLYQGLRSHEIAKVRGDDLADGMLYVLGKGGTPAYLPIHAEVAALAKQYPVADYWFPGRVDGHVSAQTVTRGVTELFRSLGIEGSLHRCRHSFGTNLVRGGVHVRKVQRLMRHGSLSTTAIYTALDEDELRDAINTLPPSA